MTAVLVLDGASLSLRDVIAVAREGRRFVLAPAARKAMTATRAVVERVVASGVPTYGVNTGFGKLSEISIADDELAALVETTLLSLDAKVIRAHFQSEFEALKEKASKKPAAAVNDAELVAA